MINVVEQAFYIVKEKKRSETSVIVFVNALKTDGLDELIVCKHLLPYKDTRYNQKERLGRHECQLEALKWNRKFTPDVYLGLAPICGDPNSWENDKLKQVCIGQILSNPQQTDLDPNKEYVLVMKYLRQEHRLDSLLHQSGQSIEEKCIYLRQLAMHISNLHRTVAIPVPEEERSWWGCKEQLKQKLQVNLDLLEPGLPGPKECAIFNELNKELPKMLEDSKFQAHLSIRQQRSHIKRCHGDLKAPNIWIGPEDQIYEEHLWKHISLLDTIDFNPGFCKIDTLSDFALLVVDIQARTGLVELTDRLVKDYLQFSHEDKKASKELLGYYLIEKAIVGASTSYRFDNDSELGYKYLMVAANQLNALMLIQGE